MAVIGGVIVLALAVAGLYDYRARRQGKRFRLTTKEAFQNRVDAEIRANPMFTGGQDWTNPAKHDPER
jgi:hypothetical protein